MSKLSNFALFVWYLINYTSGNGKHYANVFDAIATSQGLVRLDMFGLCRKPKQFDRVIDRNPYIIDALEKLGFKEITLESQFVENRITNSFYKPMSSKNY